MKNFVSPGNTVTVAAPTALDSGSGLLVGRLFGVALSSAAAGEDVALQVTGIVELVKASGTISVGDIVYYDATAQRVTTTASGNTRIGLAVEASNAAAGTLVRVLLTPGSAAA